MSTVPAEEAYPPAGLERRFLAFTLDRLLAWTAYAGFGWLAWWLAWRDGDVWTGVGVLLGGIVLVAGGLAVLTGLTGLSPGRAATGLRVVDAGTEEPLGVGRALLRAVVLGVATLPTFGFGVATLAWTAVSDPGGRRRGWHDHRAGSVVIDVRPLPEDEEDEGAEAPRQMVNLTALRLVPSAPGSPTPGTPTPGTPTPVATPASEPQQSAPAPVHAPTQTSEPAASAPATAPATAPAPAPAQPPQAPQPAPSAPPERQTLQAPLRPDPASPPAARGAGDDGPRDAAEDGAAPSAAPGGTSVAATPRGTAIPPDRPGRHRERGRARGRAAAPPPPPPWRVTFDTGESVVVEGVVLVGRRPEPRSGEQVRHVVALASQDMSLSKTHAQLHLADGVLVVMDRGSTNGSVLMRRGVARDLAANRPTTLVEGDRVRFGDREMRVEKQAEKA